MEQMREQVITMQRRVNDLLDKPGDPAAGRLKSEMQGLEDDLQEKKNPITIEDRVKRIIHLLEGEAKTNQIMNYGDLEMIKKWAEQLREHLRRMA